MVRGLENNYHCDLVECHIFSQILIMLKHKGGTGQSSNIHTFQRLANINILFDLVRNVFRYGK